MLWNEGSQSTGANLSPEKSGNQIITGRRTFSQGGEFPIGVAEDLDTRQPQNVEARFST